MMDGNPLLHRLLGHDSWTTKQFLEICASLSDEQIDHEFDIAHRTIRRTLDHVVWNIECWTDLMQKQNLRTRDTDSSMASLVHRFQKATEEFHSVALQVFDEGRLDECYLDVLDRPPKEKSMGGTILNVVTHGMHHRAQLMYMLRQLGVSRIPEGDVLTWEDAEGPHHD